jgi:predicted extracellular nuclease
LHGDTSAPLATTDLFFSEYVEGTSNNKALEIYNGTGAPVNLLLYSIEIYSNGASSPGGIKTLDGTLANGAVFVIVNSSASVALQGLADDSSNVINFNGNDAVVLRKGTTIIDVIGQIGVDPGTEWGSGNTSTADNTIVRKSSVCSGDPTGSDVFVPATQWDGHPVDTFSNLRAHNAACTPTAANVSLAGRVSTADGYGLKNATVVLEGGNILGSQTVLTGPFGYFRFDDLQVGLTYILTVRAKRYVFTDPTRVINLDAELLDVGFVAEP